MKSKFTKLLVLVLLVLGLAFTSLAITTNNTNALSGSSFNPGRIIDDIVFYNSQSMTGSQVQSFLGSKVPICDTYGQQISEFGGPDLNKDGKVQRWEWGKAYYNQTVFPCLRDYRQDTPQMEAASGLCGAIPASTGRTASQIVKSVADACNINPQVLVILLQKEQSLVTDTWPLTSQYENATGFACPDTAPCDPQYGGFFYQIYYAARQFKLYKLEHEQPTINGPTTYYDYNYRAGRTNTIYWHPDLSRCGSSQVYIENQATAGLYIYTPYRPNKAALDNLYGLGDNCSSYGNRNFWRMFRDWFGSTYAFQKMETPRWMRLKTDLYKKNPDTDVNIDTILKKGTDLMFASKLESNGILYLRTKYDTDNELLKGIKMSDLEEIPYTDLGNPIFMDLSVNRYKVSSIDLKNIPTELILKDTRVQFTQKIVINKVDYYRSAYDEARSNKAVLPVSILKPISYLTFETPRFLTVKNDGTYKVDPSTNQQDSTLIPKGSQHLFNSKIKVAGIQYYRLASDAANGTLLAIPSSSLEELRFEQDNKLPRWLRLNITTKKLSARTLEEQDGQIALNTQLRIIDKVYINNEWYYRTEYDYSRGLWSVIRLSSFEDIPYVEMETPRAMKLRVDTNKAEPRSGKIIEGIFKKGLVVKFTEKITVNSTTYLRSEYDTNLGNSYAIKFSDLQEI